MQFWVYQRCGKLESVVVQRRCSWKTVSGVTLFETQVLRSGLQIERMPGNKYNGNSSIPTDRVTRLLRERELKKISRASSLNSETLDNNKSAEPDFSHVEKYLEGAASVSPYEVPEELLPTQRLLVVANRLPVSAVRRGEDSWSLEISAGGLVSALLGKPVLTFCFPWY